MHRVISGTVFILATALCIAVSQSEAAARDQLAAANSPEASAPSDVAIDASKAVSRKAKPRVRYSVPPRKKVEGAPRRYSLMMSGGRTS
jgi:hypothetical protein